jgi:hypothetical protein
MKRSVEHRWVAVGICFVFGLAAEAVVMAEPAASALDRAAEAASSGRVKRRNIALRKLPANAKVIGLEFTVLKVDSAGSEAAVDPEDHSFQIGDSFVVKIRPQDDVYVYVFTEGPEGKRACLLPEPDGEPLLVKQGVEISLPDNGDTFTFEPPAGEEKLVVVALREPNPNLDRLAEAAFKEPGKKLGSQEQDLQAGLDPFDGLRKRGGESVRVRGGSAKEKDREFGAAVEKLAANAGQVVVPPDETTPHTEVVGMNKSEIIVDIPLRSSTR